MSSRELACAILLNKSVRIELVRLRTSHRLSFVSSLVALLAGSVLLPFASTTSGQVTFLVVAVVGAVFALVDIRRARKVTLAIEDMDARLAAIVQAVGLQPTVVFMAMPEYGPTFLNSQQASDRGLL